MCQRGSIRSRPRRLRQPVLGILGRASVGTAASGTVPDGEAAEFRGRAGLPLRPLGPDKAIQPLGGVMKVLIGVDGSPLSLDAVRMVARLIDPARDEVAIYFSPTELERQLQGQKGECVQVPSEPVLH